MRVRVVGHVHDRAAKDLVSAITLHLHADSMLMPVNLRVKHTHMPSHRHARSLHMRYRAPLERQFFEGVT
jgi:hypothetical protein